MFALKTKTGMLVPEMTAYIFNCTHFHFRTVVNLSSNWYYGYFFTLLSLHIVVLNHRGNYTEQFFLKRPGIMKWL